MTAAITWFAAFACIAIHVGLLVDHLTWRRRTRKACPGGTVTLIGTNHGGIRRVSRRTIVFPDREDAC